MKTYNPKNFPKLLILLLCTALIIFTNYIFIIKATLDIKNELIEREYKNIGGKENYMILKELQKEEMLNYLNRLKSEQPELIYKLRQKAFLGEKEENNQALTWETMKELKESSYIKGNSGAILSIIEFSDMECSYCIDSHNDGVVNKILENNKNNINYSFKNFPLKKHENGKKQAKAAKCVEKLSSGEKYLEFINNIFANNNKKGFNIENIPSIVSEIGIDVEKFNSCYLSEKNKHLVGDEILQGKKLNIKYTPSFVIINNATGEFQTLEGTSDEDLFNYVIDTFIENGK